VFKNQAWLQELLKTNNIMFVALVAKTSPSAGPAIDPTKAIKLSETCSIKLPSGPVSTACGASLLISASKFESEQHCTLGGLILVNGEVCGLTARHAFEHHITSEPSGHILDSTNNDTGILEETDDDEVSDEPFVFNGDEDINIETLSRSSTTASRSSIASSSGPQTNTTSRVEHRISLISPSLNWSSPFDVIAPLDTINTIFDPGEAQELQDWALLRGLPTVIASLPNKISHVDSRHDVLVEEVASGLVYGEVTVTVAEIGAQLGHAQPSTAMLNINGKVMNVQLITLERVLRKSHQNVLMTLATS
jgi:hypothetical protein